MKRFWDIEPFDLRLIIWNFIGYLLATVPPIVLDPKFTSHVRYSVRHYPCAWLVIPISIFVVLTTFFLVMKFAKDRSGRYRIMLFPLPFVIGTGGSVFIFPPEIPHGNTLHIMIVWYTLLILSILIHNIKVSKAKITDSKVDKEARIEFLKQNITLWRNLTFGLLAGFFAIIITAIMKMHEYNASFLTDIKELFILNIYSNIQISTLSIFYVMGPLYEAFKNTNDSIKLLLEIKREKDIAPNGNSRQSD